MDDSLLLEFNDQIPNRVLIQMSLGGKLPIPFCTTGIWRVGCAQHGCVQNLSRESERVVNGTDGFYLLNLRTHCGYRSPRG